MRTPIIAAALVAMPAAATANCDRMHSLLVSEHVGADREYNEHNPGLLLECQGWGFGAYANSEGDLSVAAYRRLPVYSASSWDAGFAVGGATGYDQMPVVPMGMGYVTAYPHEHVGITLGAMPGGEAKEDTVDPIGVLFGAVTYRF